MNHDRVAEFAMTSGVGLQLSSKMAKNAKIEKN